MTKRRNNFKEIYLTPIQAAQFLNVSLSTLKKFIYTGKLKTLKTPGGHHRILKKKLLKLGD
ncbi:MAG: helix-turn-helix domain-containing protein [Candidatus Omnitrophota bacterium]